MTDAAADLVHEVATAHHAAKLAATDRVVVGFSSGGLAFAAKGQPHALARVEAVLHPQRQEMTLTGDQPRPWTVNVVGSDDVRARLRALAAGSRRFRWQPDDVGVFAAAAIWTYVTMPLLLLRAEGADRLRDKAGLRRLRITLPAEVAGHSSVQTLHVSPDGLIRRHDYTATAFGSWARAAQVIGDYQCLDGVVVGTNRRVTPRLGRALAGPTLVWIDIHSARLT